MFLDFFFVTGLSYIIMISCRGRVWVCWNADVVKVDVLACQTELFMFVSLY
jgi:hypothetical protein